MGSIGRRYLLTGQMQVGLQYWIVRKGGTVDRGRVVAAVRGDGDELGVELGGQCVRNGVMDVMFGIGDSRSKWWHEKAVKMFTGLATNGVQVEVDIRQYLERYCSVDDPKQIWTTMLRPLRGEGVKFVFSGYNRKARGSKDIYDTAQGDDHAVDNLVDYLCNLRAKGDPDKRPFYQKRVTKVGFVAT